MNPYAGGPVRAVSLGALMAAIVSAAATSTRACIVCDGPLAGTTVPVAPGLEICDQCVVLLGPVRSAR